MALRSRSWCFTDNECREDVWEAASCQYMVFGREVAPTTGQRHLQGFLHFVQPKALTGLKKLHPTAHFEPMKGTPIQAIAYCKKDGDFQESGDPPAQGKRTDLAACCEMVKAGATSAEIATLHPTTFVVHQRGLVALRAALLIPRVDPPQVYWYYGDTGTGKTRKAFELGGPTSYFKPMDTQFWEGYAGQETCILDDLRQTSFPFDQLLRLLDRYPLTVSIKGTSCPFVSKRIIITCPVAPEALFVNHTTGVIYEHIGQLLRRITETVCFNPSVEPFCPYSMEL